jgi:hypothetical protein
VVRGNYGLEYCQGLILFECSLLPQSALYFL